MHSIGPILMLEGCQDWKTSLFSLSGQLSETSRVTLLLPIEDIPPQTTCTCSAEHQYQYTQTTAQCWKEYSDPSKARLTDPHLPVHVLSELGRACGKRVGWKIFGTVLCTCTVSVAEYDRQVCTVSKIYWVLTWAGVRGNGDKRPCARHKLGRMLIYSATCKCGNSVSHVRVLDRNKPWSVTVNLEL